MTCLCFGPPVSDCLVHGLKADEQEESGGMCIDVAELMHILKIDVSKFNRKLGESAESAKKARDAFEAAAAALERLAWEERFGKSDA